MEYPDDWMFYTDPYGDQYADELDDMEQYERECLREEMYNDMEGE